MTEDKIVDKITKLLAKAERAGTEEEAQAFFDKAQEMMAKHAIDEMVIAQRRGGPSREEPTTEFIEHGGTYFIQDVALFDELAKANTVKCFYRNWGKGAGQRGTYLAGYPSDIANVKLLWTSMQLQQVRALNLAVKNEPSWKYMTAMEKFVWRRSFREAFAGRVGRRLQEARDTAAREHDAGDMLPAIRTRAAEVEQYMQDNHRLGKGRARTTKWSAAGGNAGRAAGNNADTGATRVNAGVKGSLGR